MKFLFEFVLNYLTITLMFVTSVSSNGPLVCEWKHKSGKSGYDCPNGLFTDNEGDLWGSVAQGGYTMLQKVEPDDVMLNNWPIDIANVIQGLYYKINQERQIHRAGELTVNQELEKTAQQRADELAQKNPKYSTIWKNGESNAHVSKNDLSKLVDEWYGQRHSYDYNNPEGNFVLKTGDFSQLVWDGSKTIGCGVSNNGPDYYGVCIYNPPGNVAGEYQRNVKKDYATVDLRFGGR
uniref:CAP domain-containing protein (inferred by orthology to a human protein) n=1 Tax=Strongyloides venezuelensis TaxID=75913 RepID=A0A0K0F595_STRVS